MEKVLEMASFNIFFINGINGELVFHNKKLTRIIIFRLLDDHSDFANPQFKKDPSISSPLT